MSKAVSEARDEHAHEEAKAFVSGAVENLHEAGLTDDQIREEIARLVDQRLGVGE